MPEVVWVAAVTVMAGAELAAAAFVLVDLLWLWVAAAVLVAVGMLVWVAAGACTASARGRVQRPRDRRDPTDPPR